MGAYVSSEPPKTKWSILQTEIAKLGEEFEVEFDDGEHGLENYDRCKKNKDHKNMIPVKNFSMSDLPIPWRIPKVFGAIMYWAQHIVKIKVPYISSSRPDKYPGSAYRGKWVPTTGTGYAVITDKILSQPFIDCPIQDCPFERPHKVTPEFMVNTATHVVFDESEAKKSTIEFFYDSDDRSTVVEAQVVRVAASGVKGDQCTLTCVSHNLSLFHKIKPPSHFCQPNLFSSSLSPQSSSKDPLVVVVSHPHGCFKHVSVGEWVDLNKVEPKTFIPDDIKVKDFLRLVEVQSPAWREEGVTWEVGNHMSPEVILEMERVVQQNTELTLGEWGQLRGNVPLALSFMSYTAATCPGSSGSLVLVFMEDKDGDVSPGVYANHSGHRKGKWNISGLVWIESDISEEVKEYLDKLSKQREHHNQC